MKLSHSAGALLAVLAVGCGRVGYGSDGPVTTRVSLDGHVVKDHAYAIAASEEGFAIAWVEYPPGTTDFQVSFARTAHDGDLLGRPRVIVGTELDPSVTGIGVHQRADLGIDVLFTESDEVCLARLDSVGTVIMLYQWPLPNAVSGASFVAHPTGYAMLYERRISGTSKVHLQWLSEIAEPLGSELQLDPTGANQFRGRGIWDGEEIWAIWLDNAGADDRVRFARVSLDGTLTVAPAGLLDDGSDQRVPEIAWTGTHALVSYAQDDFVKTLALMRDGSTWPAPVSSLLAPRRESPDMAVAARGGTAVVAAEYDWLSGPTLTAYTILDADDPTARPSETAALSDTAWSYCVPKAVAGSSSFGVVFRGDVEGSRRLLLSVVRP
jgi:hypothetical protein